MIRQSLQPSKVTINDLAGMISRLENRLVLRIDGVDDRISSLEKRMEKRFDDVQSQIDHIYKNYATVREHSLLRDRVKRVERKVGIKISV